MNEADQDLPSRSQLLEENARLLKRLEKAEETLKSMRYGRAKSRAGAKQRPLDQLVFQGDQPALNDSEERAKRQAAELDAILQSLPGAVTIYDRNGRVIRTNKLSDDFMGYIDVGGIETGKGKSVKVQVLDSNGQPVEGENRPVKRALAGEMVKGEILQIRHASDEPIWISSSAAPVYKDGMLSGAVEVLTDITSIKVMEEDLKRSEKKYRELVKYAPVGIYQLDFRTRKFTSVNEVVCQQTGYTRDELLSMSPYDILDEPSQALFTERLHRWLAGEKPAENVEYRLTAKDGHEICAILNVTFTRDEQGTPLGATVVGYDITERKQAEQALQHERDLLQAVMDGAKNSHLVYLDRDFNFVRVNQAYADTCGYMPAEMIGKNHFTLYPHAENEAIFVRVRDTGEPVEYRDKPFEFPDQPERGVTYWDWTLIPVKAGGEVTGLIFSLYETTRRKQAEDALRQSEARYRQLIEVSPDAIFVNRGGKIVLANQAALNLFGVESAGQQVLGKDPLDFFHPSHHELIRARTRTLFGGGSVPVIEVKVVRPDGTLRAAEVTAALLKDEEGFAAQVILHDVTERKEREAELKQLNRTLKALSNINQAMVRATDEADYMKDVCRIVIEDCGHAMTWIGLAQDDQARSVKPAASAGFEEGYLETLDLTWADTSRGRGPTGTAIRTGKVNVCRNMLTDPAFEPWRKEALKRGYASSISLPLLSQGQAFGALSIYSEEPDPFSESELKLLGELASDLAYGITMIRTRAAQVQAEAALQRTADDLRAANVELTRFNHAMVGRELRMIELKKEINTLCERTGEPRRYVAELEELQQKEES